jgi:hypothetical protein
MNPPQQTRIPTVTEQLEATSQSFLAAHEAHLREATDSVSWERRGWLGRLAQVRRVRDRD